MSFECVPVAVAGAEALVPILHDAEEDDDRIRAALRDPACQAYAARTGGDTVGAAVVRWAPPGSELLYLAVVPGARGTGLGRRIVAALQAELATRGGTMLVGTANSSLHNIAFYQKCGFRMRSVKRDFFAYIQPPIVEDGIPMRDMIVFSYDSSTAGLVNASA